MELWIKILNLAPQAFMLLSVASVYHCIRQYNKIGKEADKSLLQMLSLKNEVLEKLEECHEAIEIMGEKVDEFNEIKDELQRILEEHNALDIIAQQTPVSIPSYELANGVAEPEIKCNVLGAIKNIHESAKRICQLQSEMEEISAPPVSACEEKPLEAPADGIVSTSCYENRPLEVRKTGKRGRPKKGGENV